MRLTRISPTAPGLHRVRDGASFRYIDAGGWPVGDASTLARIEALVIPPAWEDVWICPIGHGHPQALGTDAVGRRQYRYHDQWRLARDRVLACAVRLPDLGFLRVGSERYAAQNQTRPRFSTCSAHPVRPRRQADPTYRVGVKPVALALAGLVLVPGSAHAAGRSQDVTWHGTQIRAYDAQAAGRGGADVLVAVLDSWVDVKHPDFEGRARAGADCTTGTCVAGQTRDGCTHGTHVAGTIGASSFGIAPKSLILPVRVLKEDSNGDCTGSPDVVAAGIRYAVAQGAKVLNLSLGPDVPGLSSSSAIPTAVSAAARAGAVVVFSAGNADLPVAQAYGNDALVVAATGPNGRLASYSQHGQGVSVAAPGGQPDAKDQCTQSTCVTSLYPGGQYAVAAGTSMAAPHVSALAALLLGQQPTRGRQDVLDRITSTARPLSGAGAGLVDARAALGVGAAATPTGAPTHAPSRIPSPAPKPAPTRLPAAAKSPSPVAVALPATTRTPAPNPVPTSSVPTGSASSSAVPSDEPSPLTSRPAEAAGLPAGGSNNSVPTSVGVLAGVLVLGAAGSLLATRRRWS